MSVLIAAACAPADAPRPQDGQGRHGFAAPWREPRVLVIDILDEHMSPASLILRLPLYDVLIGDAAAIWTLVSGSVRLLGAAYADVVECIADGAEWIWKRAERLRTLAEIPAAKVVEVLDFYHASQYLSETLATCHTMPKAQRHALYKRLRQPRCGTRQTGLRWSRRRCRPWPRPIRRKAIPWALRYAGTGASHALCDLEARQLPSALARSRRGTTGDQSALQAPGSFWTEAAVRAPCICSRPSRRDGGTRSCWESSRIHSKCQALRLLDNAVPQPSAAIQGEAPQAFRDTPKEGRGSCLTPMSPVPGTQ